MGNSAFSFGRCLLSGVYCVFVLAAQAGAKPSEAVPLVTDKYGAIVRGNVNDKKLALIFTGDEFGESVAPILGALKQRQIKAAFFVTGRFARDKALHPLLVRAIGEGHYIGPHSDSHPLYASWDERDKSLVTEEFF